MYFVSVILYQYSVHVLRFTLQYLLVTGRMFSFVFLYYIRRQEGHAIGHMRACLQRILWDIWFRCVSGVSFELHWMEGIGDVRRGLATPFPRSRVIAPVSHWSCRSRREAHRVLGKLRWLESWTRDPSRRNFLQQLSLFKHRTPRLIFFSFIYKLKVASSYLLFVK